jgi:Thiamine monophosphate synthase
MVSPPAAAVMRTQPSLAEARQRLKPPAAAHPLPPLILMTDRARLADPLAAVRALPRGAAVIVRDYEYRDRAALAASLQRVCRRRGMRLLIAGDWRLAVSVGADGVHLPEWQVRRGVRPPPGFRRRWLVTAAAHSPAAVRRAAALGVDAVLVSPVFPTTSHPGKPTLGPIRFARLVRLSPVPVYPLGGITPTTAKRLAGCRAAGLAGIGGLSRLSPRRSRRPR